MNNLFDKLKYLWILAIIYFIIKYLYENYELVLNTINYIPIFNLFIASLCILISKFLLSYVSLLSTYYFNKKISYTKMFKIYNTSQLAKYIPGSIWQFVGKSTAYSIEGLEKNTILKSIFIEMLWIISSATIFGVFLISINSTYLTFELVEKSLSNYYIFYLFLFLLFILIFLFKYKEIKSFISIIFTNYAINIKILLVLLTIWCLLGLSFIITLIPYLENTSASTILYIIGLYSFAYSIGFLIPFAPAGIGIRESILALGISSLLLSTDAWILASLNRVIYIIVELSISLFYIIPNILNKKEKSKKL